MATNTHEKNDAKAVDIGAQNVAAAYAKAFIAAVENAAGGKAAAEDAVLAELDSWVDDVLARQPKLDAVLSSGMVAPEEKCRMLDRVLAGKANPLLVKLLKVLANHGRLDITGAVRDAARTIQNQKRNRFQVKVITAAPLEPKQSAALRDRLAAMLGGEPVLTHEVDPGVIGGLVVRVGDVVFDGSLATNLARLREQLVNRSVHEIQRRRDRFSTAAGN
jgi:F-type H+-transporting ATPase subunit delta